MACFMLSRQPVIYPTPAGGVCPFYSYTESKTALTSKLTWKDSNTPRRCADEADWIKFQLG